MPIEHIDYCAVCGLMDHHCVNGICPGCRPMVKEICCDDDGMPLGADAGVHLSPADLETMSGSIPPLCDEY